MAKHIQIDGVERFDELIDWVQSAKRRLEGRGYAESAYDRKELEPGYSQLHEHLTLALNHLRSAEVWAREMGWIIEEELLPPRSERALARDAAR